MDVQRGLEVGRLVKVVNFEMKRKRCGWRRRRGCIFEDTF